MCFSVTSAIGDLRAEGNLEREEEKEKATGADKAAKKEDGVSSR